MGEVIFGIDFKPKHKASQPEPQPFELQDPNAVIRKALFGEVEKMVQSATELDGAPIGHPIIGDCYDEIVGRRKPSRTDDA